VQILHNLNVDWIGKRKLYLIISGLLLAISIFSLFFVERGGPRMMRGLPLGVDFRGGAIVIANHSSHFDTPVVLAALPGRVRGKIAIAAAADKFYAVRRKRTWWYSLFLNTFPVHRGGGTKQLEYPLSLLRRGWSILIYPEGGRSKSGHIARFKAGPAIMAMQAKVPVIPIYMEGLRDVMPKGQRTPRPAAARARIGRPISLDGVTSIPEATAMLENAMRELAGQRPHHAPQGVPAAAEPAIAPAGGSG